MSERSEQLRTKPFTITPNDVPRCEVCPASRIFVGPRDKPTHAMWHGIALHRFIEYAKTRSREAALLYIGKKFKHKLELCKKIDVDSIPDGEYEPQYVIDIERRIALTVHDHADADPAEHVYMRGDVVWETASAFHVADYKTGDPAKQKLRAADNVQLLTIATAVWLERNEVPSGVHAELVSVSSDGVMHWGKNAALFSADQLRAHLKRLRRVHLEVLETRAEYHQEGVEPDFVPGPHCYGCRARLACDACPEEFR